MKNRMLINWRVLYAVILPSYLLLHCSIAFLNKEEVFPFFSWSLFSNAPLVAWNQFILVHSIDDKPPTSKNKYIGAFNHRSGTNLQKKLGSLKRQCMKLQTSDLCEERVAEMIFPIVSHFTGGNTINFSLIYCTMDFELVIKKIDDTNNRLPIFNEQDCDKTQTVILGPWTMESEV